MRAPILLTLLVTAGCVAPTPPNRPMDEVPAMSLLTTGDRSYEFVGGCRVVLEPKRAVVRSQTANCAVYHRDIALLYASAD